MRDLGACRVGANSPNRREIVSVPHLYLAGALVSALLAPRFTYRVYEALNLPTIALVILRVGLVQVGYSGWIPLKRSK